MVNKPFRIPLQRPTVGEAFWWGVYVVGIVFIYLIYKGA